MADLKSGSPQEFTPQELDAFHDIVLESGEVDPNGLRDRIGNAAHLVSVLIDGVIASVGAIKNPNPGYRDGVFKKSDTELAIPDDWIEVGWFSTTESQRQQGFGKLVRDEILQHLPGTSCFLTTRANNDYMTERLESWGFSKTGTPYDSNRGDYQICLFVYSQGSENAG
jgi:hypothetical protein